MSNILHVFWHPEPNQDFLQKGGFRLWIETAELTKTRQHNLHPRHFNHESLGQWLKECLGSEAIAPCQFEQPVLMLPTAQGYPLPCPELMIEWTDELLDQTEWAAWAIACYRLTDSPINTLNEFHYRLIFQSQDIRPGQDFLFWYYYTQSLKTVLQNDQYIPSLRCRQELPNSPYEYHAGWEYLSEVR